MATSNSAVAKRSVLIIDDHPIVRQGLAQLINQEPDLVVTGQAASAKDAVSMIESSPPDIAIVDISLDDRSGIDLIKELRTDHPTLLVLALSMHDESLYAERALRAGAKGYIMKQEATEKVMTAIRKVLDGQVYVSDKMAARLLDHFVSAKPNEEDSPLSRLSDRELEIFSLIGRGLGTREIASKLFLSVKTVEAHREHIKDKLKLKSGTELVRMAVQHALESPKHGP